ncbi:enoyl-CoA hydratase/isomerase family protein [Acidobacteriota bacterium]
MNGNTSKSDSGLIRQWRQGSVAYVQLHRPDKANAYNQVLLEDLEHALLHLNADLEVRVIVLCGAGNRSFCAGADLDEMKGKDYRTALDLKSAKVFAALAACPKVTLAAINGSAVAGGLELALACDVRIAAESACFSFPEPKLGLIPAAGGTQRLPMVVGVARAKELILAGRVWPAEEALRHGLVSEVVTLDELLQKAQEWGEVASQRDPLALRLAKKVIEAGASSPLGYGLEAVTEALLYELRLRKQDT